MPKPIISIITGFYNTRQFLAEAIESVLKQDYDEWELLLVDDGSDDGSSEIAKNFAEKDSRIKYFEHPGHANRGVSASRQWAFDNSTGEFIALLDADDVWLENKLSSQLSIMQANPEIDLLCEASMYWFSWHNPALEDVLVPVGAPPEQLYFPGKLILSMYPLGKGAAPCPSGWMLRRNAISDTGGFDNGFKGDFQSYEDQALLVKFYLHKKVFVSSAYNNLYRQRSGSLVYNTHEQLKYKRVRKYFLEWFRKYIADNSINDVKIHFALNKAFFPYRFPTLHKIRNMFSRKVDF